MLLCKFRCERWLQPVHNHVNGEVTYNSCVAKIFCKKAGQFFALFAKDTNYAKFLKNFHSLTIPNFNTPSPTPFESIKIVVANKCSPIETLQGRFKSVLSHSTAKKVNSQLSKSFEVSSN